MNEIRKGITIGVDAGDGHLMIRKISEIKITAEGVHLILREVDKSERRWAKTKRPLER